MKKLLILTGPQGSGNHMWSKIFALHPEVTGWQDLLDTYWIGHDQEPFNDCWQNIELLKSRDWSQNNYYVTSVSCPYMNNGERTVPNVSGFVARATELNLQVTIGILGRDPTILRYQETRVRGECTFDYAQEQYAKLSFWNPIHISYELLHLYKRSYLQQLSRLLEFPIAWNSERLDEILKDDTNCKYFQPVEYHPTDDLAKHTSRKWR